MDCIFCKLVAKEMPAHVLYEDDLVMAFLDISQATKGHTLVLPKHHFNDVLTLGDVESERILKVAKKIAKAISKVYQPTGINLLSNNGASAGQTVNHFHMHIIPRYDNDGLNSFTLVNNIKTMTPERYNTIVSDITRAMES